MKFFAQFFFSALLALLLGPHFPYWVLMLLIALSAVVIKGNGFTAFSSAALGVGLVWLIVPLVIWSTTGSELPEKIGEIMGISNSALLVGISGLMGFLIGGSSALTGNLFGKLFERNEFY